MCGVAWWCLYDVNVVLMGGKSVVAPLGIAMKIINMHLVLIDIVEVTVVGISAVTIRMLVADLHGGKLVSRAIEPVIMVRLTQFVTEAM